ncbi:hypothetical protein ID866_8693 [Astraeus odoratus]|nr:hypothetical protein ID866_8693 [Astraeus odoratus]
MSTMRLQEQSLSGNTYTRASC